MSWRPSRRTAFAFGVGATALVPKKILAGGACAAVAYGAAQLVPRLSIRSSKQSAPTHATAAVRAHQTQKHVRLLSQNVWNSFFAGGPGRAQRLAAFGEYLKEHTVDVVATQEMFVFGFGPLVDEVDAKAASTMMQKLGFQYQTSYAASTPSVGQSSGLVVYSKLPITREEHHVFSARRNVSCKGWLEVEIELPTCSGSSSKLILLNTHLEHAHSQHWRCVREQQWRELIERARYALQRASPASYVAALGDFNVCGDEFGKALDNLAEYTSLKKAMSEVGLGTDLIESPAMPTMRRENSHSGLRCSVDHVFVNRVANTRVLQALTVDTHGADGLLVSDHHGIRIDLTL